MSVIAIKYDEMTDVRQYAITHLNEITNDGVSSRFKNVLGYSDLTLKQAKALSKILSSPRKGAISNNFQDIGTINKNVDMVFQLESLNPVYYFSANIADWHKKQTKDALFLNISILQENKVSNGDWLLSYIMASFDSTAPINVGSSELYPEKQMLLNFWFTKNQLDSQTALKTFSLRKHIRYAGSTLREGLLHLDFQYNGIEHAEAEARRSYIGNLAQKHSRFLKKRGNFTFSVVEIGTTQIGNKKHWVYTGSEKTFS